MTSTAGAIGTRAVVSNANLQSTIFKLVGAEHCDRDFVEQARAVRLNNSSTQVYMALQAGRDDRRGACGDLLFSSTAPAVPHRVAAEPRRHQPHLFVLLPADPARRGPLPDRLQHQRQLRAIGPSCRADDYEASKHDLIETTLDALAKYVPNIRQQLD